MSKRTFSAFLSVRGTVFYDVTVEWTGDEDPTEEEIIKAYQTQKKGFAFVEVETEEDPDDMEVTDIEEYE